MAREAFSLNYCSKLRVLVVDDDPICLSIVAATLKKFKYEVVTAKHPKDALCTLRIKKETLNLVVSDVHMPDMNGFELQKTITQEFNLPVVLMSADKGLENGVSSFFISKPVSPDDVRNLWKFATKESNERVVQEENGNSKEKSVSLPKGHKKNYLKRKEESSEEKGDNSQASSTKKAKIIWTNALHNRFLEAIRTIGLERSVPKKILEFMNVPGLTRENVASHLQKYRMFLRKVSEASYEMQYSEGSKGSFLSPVRSFQKFQYQKPGQYFPGSFTNSNSALFTNDSSFIAQSGFGQSQLASMSNIRNENLIYRNNDGLVQTNCRSAPPLFQGNVLNGISSQGGFGYSSVPGLNRLNASITHPEASSQSTIVGSSNIVPQVASRSFADQLNQRNYLDSKFRTTLYCSNNDVLNNGTAANAADDHVSVVNDDISLDQLLSQYLGVSCPTNVGSSELSGQSFIADSLQSNTAMPEIKEPINQSALFNPANNFPPLDYIVGTQQPLDQEGDLNDILQYQLNIQNQAQHNGVGTITSSTYGSGNHWDNNHVLALDNLQQQVPDIVFDTSCQFNNTLLSNECCFDDGDEDDKLLESLLASF